MATYKYEIIQSNGKSKSGTLEAPNQETAAAELREGGGMIVSLTLAGAWNKDVEIHIGKAVKPRELSVFCRQFQSVLHAGVTVIDALEMLAEQTENKTFQKTILEVRDSVQKGDTLADAVSEHPKIFPDIMVHMIAAGEASGSLEKTFDRLAGQFEKDAHLKALVGKSMIYPIILVIVIIAVVAIMMIKIVPTFTETFDELDAELPGITLAVMGVSDFLINRGYLILLAAAAVFFLVHEVKKTEKGALFFGKLGLKMPLFGKLTIKTAAARLTRTLSTLMNSGIKMVDAIHIVGQIMTNECR